MSWLRSLTRGQQLVLVAAASILAASGAALAVSWAQHGSSARAAQISRLERTVAAATTQNRRLTARVAVARRAADAAIARRLALHSRNLSLWSQVTGGAARIAAINGDIATVESQIASARSAYADLTVPSSGATVADVERVLLHRIPGDQGRAAIAASCSILGSDDAISDSTIFACDVDDSSGAGHGCYSDVNADGILHDVTDQVLDSGFGDVDPCQSWYPTATDDPEAVACRSHGGGFHELWVDRPASCALGGQVAIAFVRGCSDGGECDLGVWVCQAGFPIGLGYPDLTTPDDWAPVACSDDEATVNFLVG